MEHVKVVYSAVNTEIWPAVRYDFRRVRLVYTISLLRSEINFLAARAKHDMRRHLPMLVADPMQLIPDTACNVSRPKSNHSVRLLSVGKQ